METVMKKKLLTTRNIAEYCDVTIHAVNKWVNAGKLKAYRTPGNHKKISEEKFIEFLQKFNMVIPEDFESKMHKMKRILIVDDDKNSVHLIKGLLNKLADYEIKSAYDGFKAGVKYCAFKPDLITLDLKMMGMDGFEVCSYIRNEHKNDDVKILAVSAYLENGNKKRILDLGADDCLSKPFNSQEFRDKVLKLLNTKGERV